jgi:hypothetical protein
MTKDLYLAAPSWTGIWHRFRVIDHARVFAKHAGCKLHFLWAASHGVSNCRFEELLSPIPAVQIFNLSEAEMDGLEQQALNSKSLDFRDRKLEIYRVGGKIAKQMFAFDFDGARALEATTASSTVTTVWPLQVIPAAGLCAKAGLYIRKLQIPQRVGIRVRVTECDIDGRKPRRVQAELDDAIRSIVRIPWYVPVFLVTDSEYIQQMLASHFHDSRYLPKRFTERGKVGHYVSRLDKDGMQSFLIEVSCLLKCRKIINIGGFLNQDSVAGKIIPPPWKLETVGLRRAL